VTLLAGCGGGAATTLGPHFDRTSDYRTGVAADVYLPDGSGPAPVVVLVPGGGWSSAHRTGLGPLAERLASSGAVVVNATYRTQSDGVRFPVPVEDVVCAVNFGAAQAVKAGRSGGPLVVVGHSAGAHLAALAALSPARFQARCPYPVARVDGLVGLSGPYDVSRLPELARPLFGVGPEEKPDAWRAGNPMAVAAERPGMAVLLLHGSSDTVVPADFTVRFAEALRAGGHQVSTRVLPGVDHGTYRKSTVWDVVASWVDRLQAARS
jgi:acetyl esterase/lipase